MPSEARKLAEHSVKGDVAALTALLEAVLAVAETVSVAVASVVTTVVSVDISNCLVIMIRRTFTIILILVPSICAHAQVEDFLQYAPLASRMVLPMTKVESRYSMQDRLFVAVTSIGLTYGATGALKHIVSERRPDGSDRKSFPSGHAARAFLGANMLRHEYGHISPWISVAGYAVATATATLRVTGKHHYTHDVLVGAAIGFASSELSFALLPLWHKYLDKKKNKKLKRNNQDFIHSSDQQSVDVVMCPIVNNNEFGVAGTIVF